MAPRAAQEGPKSGTTNRTKIVFRAKKPPGCPKRPPRRPKRLPRGPKEAPKQAKASKLSQQVPKRLLTRSPQTPKKPLPNNPRTVAEESHSHCPPPPLPGSSPLFLRLRRLLLLPFHPLLLPSSSSPLRPHRYDHSYSCNRRTACPPPPNGTGTDTDTIKTRVAATPQKTETTTAQRRAASPPKRPPKGPKKGPKQPLRGLQTASGRPPRGS